MPNASNVPVKREDKPVRAPERAWRPIEALRQEVDRLFNDFGFSSWPSQFAHVVDRFDLPQTIQWPVAPAVDMTEKDGQYEITAELPGMDDKNVEVKVANGVLTIKGEKTEEKEEEKKDYHLSERRYGSFQRSFRLPDGVDADKIEAHFAKGLLSVKIPKTAEAVKNEKKIEVKAG